MSPSEPRHVMAVAVVLLAAMHGTAGAQHFTQWDVPESVGVQVNSASLDGCPAISRDGLSLYLASRREGNQLDIYVSQREGPDDPWGVPRGLGPAINTPASTDFCPALSRDGHRLYFASNRPGGCGGADLYVSRRRNRRDDFAWEAPQHLGCIVNSPADDFGPNYYETEDGIPVIYFNSNRTGGFGLQDIYEITMSSDGTFGPAVPVVELNTTTNDQQPAIRRDGLEIIFTSTRPGGYGGTDLWQSTRESTADLWSPPVNMGETINGPLGDSRPALSWDGTELFFGSTRPGGQGADDVYVAKRSKARP